MHAPFIYRASEHPPASRAAAPLHGCRDARRPRCPGGRRCTVYVLDAGQEQHKVRLASIDAPERGQPFGTKAKEHLSDLVVGQDVTVEWNKRGRYGRIIGKVLHGGQDVNLGMVGEGLAWWYRKYSREQSPADRGLYEAAEDTARTEQRGLWVDPDPVAPWEWRKQKRANR